MPSVRTAPFSGFIRPALATLETSAGAVPQWANCGIEGRLVTFRSSVTEQTMCLPSAHLPLPDRRVA
jgi:hypothetical protein